jgi:hypothetical protein
MYSESGLVPSPSLFQNHVLTGVTSFEVYVSDIIGRLTLKNFNNLIITLKMFINFIGNIFYVQKRNIIVSLYIVNVTLGAMFVVFEQSFESAIQFW